MSPRVRAIGLITMMTPMCVDMRGQARLGGRHGAD